MLFRVLEERIVLTSVRRRFVVDRIRCVNKYADIIYYNIVARVTLNMIKTMGICNESGKR